MSSITIYTHDLTAAAQKSRTAAGSINGYWGDLNSKVLSKIKSYGSSYGTSGNLNTAQNNVRNETELLIREKGAFERFAQAAESLRERAETIEKRIISTINGDLRAYANRYGLAYSDIREQGGFVTGLIYSMYADIVDFKQMMQFAWERFKEWYHYDGGREWIKAGLAVIGAVLSIALAILTFPANCIVAAVTAAILLVISIFNAIVQIMHAINAVWEAEQDHYINAAWESHKRDTGSFTDELRSNGYYELANIIDTIGLVAEVVKFVYDLGSFAKKAQSFFKDFDIKGYIKDIGKNFKEFFNKDALERMLFGGTLEGGFFNGKLVEVLGRVDVVFNIIEAGYETVDFYDPFNTMTVGEKMEYYWKTWKPAFKNIMKNIITENGKRRHDIVAIPNDNKPAPEDIYDSKTHDLIADTQTYSEELVDESTGKKVGTRETTIKHIGGKTITDQTSTYEYEGIRGTGETKTVTEHSEESGKKEYGNYHKSTEITTTTTKKTDDGKSWQSHIKTVSTEEKSSTITTVYEKGVEKSETTTNTTTNTKGNEYNIFKGHEKADSTTTTTKVTKTEKVDKSSDPAGDGYTHTKTETTSRTNTASTKLNNEQKYTSENAVTHTKSETFKENSGNIITENSNKTTTWTHDSAKNEVEKNTTYTTTEGYNYSNGRKGSTGETVTQKNNGNVKISNVNEKAPKYESATSSKPSSNQNVISAKVDSNSRPNIPGKINEIGKLINKYDNTAANINKVSPAELNTTEPLQAKINESLNQNLGEDGADAAKRMTKIVLDTTSTDPSRVVDDVIDWKKANKGENQSE